MYPTETNSADMCKCKKKNVSLGSSLDMLMEGGKSEIDNIIVGAH